MLKKLLTTAFAAVLFLNGLGITVEASADEDTTYTKVYWYSVGSDDYYSSEGLQNLLDNYFADHNFNWNFNEAEKNRDLQPETEQSAQTSPTDDGQQQSNSASQKTKKASGSVQSPQPSQNGENSASEQSAQLSAYEREVIDLTNQERAVKGLDPLHVDYQLSKVAQEKSRDMSTNNYFAHNSPTYGSPFDMMKQFGVTYQTAGENIAKGQRTPKAVVEAWMNSQGHRENILNPNFTHIGVGFAEEGNYWTQQFIGK